MAARIDNADPSVRAAREIVEPLQRGFELFKGDKQTSWLKKIFKSLNVFHKEDTVYNKAAKKSLKAIEEKPGFGGGYGSGSLGDKIPGIATIAKTGDAGGLLGLLTKAGRGAKGLFKRIPIIGSLLAGAGAAFDIFNSENDDSLTRREKDKAAGISIGGWMGSLGGIAAGAAAGSMLGPVGTVVGGIVGGFLGDQAGQIIGEKFGEWVSDLRQADLPGRLVSKFEQITGGFDFQKGFQLWLERTKSNIAEAENVAAEQLNDLNTYVDKNTGVNLKEMGGLWWDRTKSNAAGALDTLSGVPAWMMDNTTLGKAGKRITSAFKGSVPGMSEAQAAAFAADVRRTESSGNYGIENGRGSLGAYQFDAAALADTGLVSSAKLKAAKKSGQYNQKSFLADPANWTLAGGKDAFLSDSSLQDKTFQDMQALNFKRGVRSGAISMAAKPEEVAAYLKAAHLGGATGASDYFLRGRDRSDGLTLISQYAKQGALAVASAPKISRPPSPPSMPAIAEAPRVVEPLGSPVTPQFTVSLPAVDVGQTVRDSTVAYIQSGAIHKR
ncbi:MAG: hypothetical protein KGZ69_12440 [Methylomonas sp.]|nr:hypothetical protein [Methylomonas sp.]